MRKYIQRAVAVIVCLMLNGITEEVFSQDISIPDANFENLLIEEGFDTNGATGSIRKEDAERVTVLNLANADILDLTGIEGFSNLEELYCQNNGLTSLDVSRNTQLRVLNCSNNSITTLDLTNNGNLDILLANNNELTTLDLRNGNNSSDTVKFIKNSVFGIISDEFGLPVDGATVTVAGHITKTSALGIYEFENIDVPASWVPLVVRYTRDEDDFSDRSTQEYFKRTAAYLPSEGVRNRFDVRIASREIVATLNGNTGGEAVLGNGSKITFPENSVIDANGDLYTGVFYVFAHFIDPTSETFEEELPGILVGDAADDFRGLITPYSMLTVEIESEEGDRLELAPEKNASLTFFIPEALQASAPNTIPLWSLDESTAAWVEEGTAIRQGITYVGEVAHFSTWNCDIFRRCEPVRLSGTIVNRDGKPLSNIKVCVNEGSLCQLTAFGQFEFIVPDCRDIILSLSVLPDACQSGGTYNIRNLGMLSGDTDLGDVPSVVPPGYVDFELVGNVRDIEGNPIPDPILKIIEGANAEIKNGLIRAGTDGVFIVAGTSCGPSQNASLMAYDIRDVDNPKESDPKIITLQEGTTSVGTITVGNSINTDEDGGATGSDGTVEFVKFDFDGERVEILQVLGADNSFRFVAIDELRATVQRGSGDFDSFLIQPDPDIFPIATALFDPVVNTNGVYFTGRINGVEFEPARDMNGQRIPNAIASVNWIDVPPRSLYDYEDLCSEESSQEPFLMRGTFTMEATDIDGQSHQFTNGSIRIVFDVFNDYIAFEACFE